MPAAALIFAPTIAGGALLSKKAKAKRAQAASNKWSTQFPLVDDYASMQAMIDKANLQLKTLNAQKGGTKKFKAEKAELAKWLGVMKSHLKDLKVGLDMASTNVQVAPTPTAIAESPLPIGQEATTNDSVASGVASGALAAVQSVASGENLATDTKKGTNWLLIGGVVVGVVVLYKLFKK